MPDHGVLDPGLIQREGETARFEDGGEGEVEFAIGQAR